MELENIHFEGLIFDQVVLRGVCQVSCLMCFVHFSMLLSAMRELIRVKKFSSWQSEQPLIPALDTADLPASCAFTAPSTWAPSNFYRLLFCYRGLDGLTLCTQEWRNALSVRLCANMFVQRHSLIGHDQNVKGRAHEPASGPLVLFFFFFFSSFPPISGFFLH